MIHYSFDLRFSDVDVAFVLGSFCLGLGLGLGGWCLGLVGRCLGLGLEGCCLVNNTASWPYKTRQTSLPEYLSCCITTFSST